MGDGNDHSHDSQDERGLRIALALTGGFVLAEVSGKAPSGQLNKKSTVSRPFFILAISRSERSRNVVDTFRKFIFPFDCNKILLFVD